jgi:DNA-binding NarL/FixJ family response regulator
MVRLLIYEDNEKLRKSLKLLMSGMSDIVLLDAIANCLKVADDIHQNEPDVVLMDIDMPGMNGIEAVSLIKESRPETHVLMHTIFDDDDKIYNSLAAGADGYLLKTASPMELYNAIKDVNSGGAPLSPGVAKKVLESFRKPEKSRDRELIDLSQREREILQMLTKGFTYKRISSECAISIDTTRTHIKNIYTKLHVNCGTEAVAKALRLRLFR